MIATKNVRVAFALGSFGLLAAGCTEPDSLLDRATAQSEFGPQIASRVAQAGGAATDAAGGGGQPGAGGGAQETGGGDSGGPVTTLTPSPGCTKAPPDGQSVASYFKYTMHVSGETLDPSFHVEPHDRDYFVWLPKGYDPNKPYRITFLFMGCGDRTAANTATYKLMGKDPGSIYVAMNMPPVGFPPAGKDCYDNTEGMKSLEWDFMGLVATKVQNDFCIDESRVFVAGYSSGAWVSNMFGCYFAGKDSGRKFGPGISVRGQSSVTGGPVLPDVPCGGKVAAMWIHDSDDKENIIGGNLSTSLPRVLKVNGCTGGVAGPTVAWGISAAPLPNFCKRYTACPAEFPVIFCATSGKGHGAQDDLAVPGFLEFQDLMNH